MNREDILNRPSYWFEHEQNELFRQVSEYMERENINRTELAKRLKVHKSYVSQILNGNFNYTLKKWIELCLAIGIVPGKYRKLVDVIKEDEEFSKAKKDSLEKKTESIILPSDYRQQISLVESSLGDGYSLTNYKSEDFKFVPTTIKFQEKAVA